MRIFSPVSEMRKRPKILRTSFGAKLEKQNKDGETQPSYYFCASIMALATLFVVSLQLNGLLMMWKIHQAKPCCVMKLCCYVIEHLMHTLLRRIHPGNQRGPKWECRSNSVVDQEKIKNHSYKSLHILRGEWMRVIEALLRIRSPGMFATIKPTSDNCTTKASFFLLACFENTT